ncbi:MAG: hypothetical protein HRT73_08225 [Flavobacteriales bacterium]|nr:hypothetical protein [Flavobacteriales bacterium]
MYSYNHVDRIFGTPLNELLIVNKSGNKDGSFFEIGLTLFLITAVAVVAYNYKKEEEKSTLELT